jgi:hypothetical protein
MFNRFIPLLRAAKNRHLQALFCVCFLESGLRLSLGPGFLLFLFAAASGIAFAQAVRYSKSY